MSATSGYHDRAHLAEDIEAAREVATGLFVMLATSPVPDRQAGLDALGAVWAWLDVIERDAGALVPPLGGGR